MGNVNFPTVEYGWGSSWGVQGGSVPLARFTDVTPRTQGSVSPQRGRQYELDQVQAGSLSATLRNVDGALDSTNASSPFAGHIAPYQPYRVRAQWPVTRNLLTPATATGGEGLATGAITPNNALPIYSDTAASSGSVVASGTAWQGTNVLSFDVPSSSAALQRVFHTAQVAAVPGGTYTFSAWIRNVTAATTLSVKAHVGFYGPADGAPSSYVYAAPVTLTGSSTAAWTQVTVTGTAPANAAGLNVGVSVNTTAAAACTIQADGMQHEKGSAATTWQTPGTWYPIYAGFVERWPQSWALNGTYGVVQPTAVDAFALLSQRVLDDPLTEEINKHAPRFLYTLADPQGATAAVDVTGNLPAAQVSHSKQGVGSLVFGSSITAADVVNGVYTGSSGTVATLNNPSPGTQTFAPSSFVDLASAGVTGPADTHGQWSRMIAFRYTGPTPAAGSSSMLWSCVGRNGINGASLRIQIGADGTVGALMSGPTGGAVAFGGGTANVVDSNWHLVVITYNHASATFAVNVDGNGFYYGGTASSAEPVGLVSDTVGAYVDPTIGYASANNYKGDISFVAEFTTELLGAEVTDLYHAWRSSFAGDSTDVRYQRILTYAGFGGASSIATGSTTSMGPAALAGQDALSALQSVVDTENGEHYVSADGTIVFKSRAARYNALTPMYVFGEREDLGEYPYEDAALDYDSTHLGNIAAITQESTSQVFTATDLDSKNKYFARTLSRTVNSTSALECADAASYLVSRYKEPTTRVSGLKLHPAANPALWPVCLGMELGTRVRIMRRPLGRPAIQVDAFVEKLDWVLDDEGEAFLTLQCSPVDLTPYGIFSIFHTTLAAPVNIGDLTLTINAPPGSTNPLASQLVVGQGITVGLGTSAREGLSIKSLAVTSPSWTTAVVTLNGAAAKAHLAGANVTDMLPTGVTLATTYDASAKFDSVALSY